MYPRSTLHYIQLHEISHVPTLYATQHVWLDWIGDRFKGVRPPRGCQKELLEAATGTANGAGQNWFIEYDVYGL